MKDSISRLTKTHSQKAQAKKDLEISFGNDDSSCETVDANICVKPQNIYQEYAATRAHIAKHDDGKILIFQLPFNMY